MVYLYSRNSCRPVKKIKSKMDNWIRLIFLDRTSRMLLCFLVLNLSFGFVELLYGVWTNCLSLISDSFHMFLDCTGLITGLAASVISRWHANETFSYGYVRAEILSGFVNGLILLFISFVIFTEAIGRIIEPPDVHSEQLFIVALAGFVVNIIGIFVFRHGHSHNDAGLDSAARNHGNRHKNLDNEHSRSQKSLNPVSSDHEHSNKSLKHHQGHSHSSPGSVHSLSHEENENNTYSSQSTIMQGVFLHILADTLGSIGVVVSSALIYQFGWIIADPICSMFIATLIFLSVLPLIRESTAILMQRTPKALDNQLQRCYQRINTLEGVYGINESHFWTLCTGVYVGNITIEIANYADSQYILNETQTIFSQVGVKHLHVQINRALLEAL